MAPASIPRLSPPRWRQLHVVALLLLLLALAPPNYCGATDANPQQPKEHFIPGQEAAKLQGKLFHCAWQFETSHARCNMGVIDKTARYAGWTLFPNHRVYKLRGRYPTEGIYYAVTIYDTRCVSGRGPVCGCVGRVYACINACMGIEDHPLSSPSNPLDTHTCPHTAACISSGACRTLRSRRNAGRARTHIGTWGPVKGRRA